MDRPVAVTVVVLTIAILVMWIDSRVIKSDSSDIMQLAQIFTTLKVPKIWTMWMKIPQNFPQREIEEQ